MSQKHLAHTLRKIHKDVSSYGRTNRRDEVCSEFLSFNKNVGWHMTSRLVLPVLYVITEESKSKCVPTNYPIWDNKLAKQILLEFGRIITECECCGQVEDEDHHMSIHHCDRRKNINKAYDPLNLLVLCNRCHAKEEARLRKCKRIIIRIR